jgi:hypothetical protein
MRGENRHMTKHQLDTLRIDKLERKAALLDEAIQALHETRLINLCEKIEAVLKKAEALKGEKP